MRLFKQLFRMLALTLFLVPVILIGVRSAAQDNVTWLDASNSPSSLETIDSTQVGALHQLPLGWQSTCYDRTFLTRKYLAGLPLSRQTTSYCAYQTSIGLLEKRLNNPALSADTDHLYSGKIFGFDSGIRTLSPTPNPDVLVETKNNNGGYVRFIRNPSVSTVNNLNGTPTHTLSGDMLDIKYSTGGNPVTLPLLRMEHMNFTYNGEWAGFAVEDIGFARMNMRTGEILTFGEIKPNLSGNDPRSRVSISENGRYAVTTINATTGPYWLRVYDLNNCQGTGYDHIRAPHANCAFRDFSDFIKSEVPDVLSFGSAEFTDEHTISFWANTSTAPGAYTKYSMRAPNAPAKSRTYIALGDSFASGEGAFGYFGGTDEGPEINNCHLSALSYPYLIGASLGMSQNDYHSVACSGAEIRNIIGSLEKLDNSLSNETVRTRTNQAKNPEDVISNVLGDWLPGYFPQLHKLGTTSTDTITLSIGGNDIGFSDILKRCLAVADDCFSTYEDRVEVAQAVSQLFSDLVPVYQQLLAASPNTKINIVGYPKLFDGDSCGRNVLLSAEERRFANLLVEQLNNTISSAAKKAGVNYIDIANTFAAAALCGSSPFRAANGVTLGSDLFILGNESFHPTAYGHRLIARAILSQTNSFYKQNPEKDPSITAPIADDDSEFLNAPRSGREIRQLEHNGALSADIVYQSSGWQLAWENIKDVGVNLLVNLLKPGSIIRLIINSEPVELGNTVVDQDGKFALNATLPDYVPVGFHTLHLYAEAVDGTKLDYFKTVYVGHNEADKNGNGVTDTDESCGILITPSGEDNDKDSIDDACDTEITDPPAEQEEPSKPDSPPVNHTESDKPTDNPNTTTNTHGTSHSAQRSGDKSEREEKISSAKDILGVQDSDASSVEPSTGKETTWLHTAGLVFVTLVVITLASGLLYASRNG